MAHRNTARSSAAAPPQQLERRDSIRAPIRLMLRHVSLGGSFDEHDGNVSTGGVYYTAAHPPPSALVEVRFLLPGQNAPEIHALGEIMHVSRAGRAFGSHVNFLHLPLDAELAIARYLESVAG